MVVKDKHLYNKPNAVKELLVPAWRPDLLDMLGFWYNDLTRAQDSPKVTLVEPLDAEIYYVYGLADFSCSRVSTATAGIS